MPSAHRQNHLIMERQTAVNNVASAQLSGESSSFICAECGDGFSQYSNVLTHMIVHGPLESFSFDGSSYGFEIPREYVLQENGTLTAINGLPPSNSSNSPVKPVSPGVLPSHLPMPVKPVSPTLRSQASLHKDALKPRPSHLDLDKTQQGHYRCEICNKSFNSLRSLHCHQQNRNTERGYRCTLCCKIFEDQHNLKKHLQSHISERFNYCSHCGKRFLKMDALNAHQKENHSLPKALGNNKEEKRSEKVYTCKKCKLSFFWMSDFQIHSVYYCKGQEPDVLSLSDIEMEVDSKDPEDMHLVNCHSNGTSDDVKNGDSKASKDTSDKSDLKPTFTPYRCGLCGDRFEKLSNLKEHHLTHQTQEEIDKLNQESMNIFKRRILSKGRKRRDPNGKLHPCKHCQRVFNHSSSLSRHMRYHKGTMHNCTFCGRLFPQRCDLRRHVAMYHKAELEKKPALKHFYTNPQNGPSNSVDVEKSTDTPDENTSNNEQTSTERSSQDKQSGKTVRGKYRCHECGKNFGLLCVYQRHLRYHKKEPNKCPQCPAQFKNTSSLELHLQNHPKIEKADDVGRTSHDTGTDADKALENNTAEDMEDDYVDQKETDKGSFSDALYECTECTETFLCLDTFLQHQTSHGSEKTAND